MGFQQFAFAPQRQHPSIQFGFDAVQGIRQSIFVQDVVHGGKKKDLRFGGQDFAGNGFDQFNTVDFVAKQFDANRVLLVGRPNFNHVPSGSELATLKIEFAAAVLHVDQTQKQFTAVDGVASGDGQDPVPVVLGGAQAVDARHGGHDDRVPARQEVAGCGETQAIQVIVSR